MSVEIRAVGGYKEVGKNMTAIKIDDEVVIIDMGIHLPNYINFTQDQEFLKCSAKQLINAGAIPDDSLIKDWKDKVIAITTTHGHLDHIAAIPYLASKYDCPIIATPFTCAVIRGMFEDEHLKLHNKIKPLEQNKTMKLSKNIELVFVGITHSIPDTVTIALRTPYGIITYSNDFKLDEKPYLGHKPNYKLIEALGKEGVFCSIINCLYAWNDQKTPSESTVKEMLSDVFTRNATKGNGIIVTTFSSHIARLKMIAEEGRKMKRKVVFLGRSLARYTEAAILTGICDFKGVEIIRWSRQARQKLKMIEKEGKDNYLLVVTGHQGEPQATLSKMVRGELPWHFDSDDCVVFSSQVIPSKLNEAQSAILEDQLKSKHVRIFRNVHVSGHASREDLRDFVNMLKPEHVIPSHGIPMMTDAMEDLCKLIGMKKDKIHSISTGDSLILK